MPSVRASSRGLGIMGIRGDILIDSRTEKYKIVHNSYMYYSVLWRIIVAREALKEIERYLKNPPETSWIITVDPASAEVLLEERNEGNRPPKPNKVQQFATDMSSKRWGLTGDTLKFAPDGRLLDGQNRLAACVRSNKPFTTHVVFNIDPQLFGRMDIGKPRNPADVLHIAGYKYASTLAAAVRWTYLLDTNPYNRETLRPEFVLDLVRDKYPDIEPYLKEGRAVNKQYAHPAGQIAALIYKFAKSDLAKSEISCERG